MSESHPPSSGCAEVDPETVLHVSIAHCPRAVACRRQDVMRPSQLGQGRIIRLAGAQFATDSTSWIEIGAPQAKSQSQCAGVMRGS